MTFVALNTNKKMLVITLASVALLAGCQDNDKDPGEKPLDVAGKPLEINILHINDHHSHLDEESTTLQLETSAGTREAVTVNRGGFPRVAALINSKAETLPNPIKIHAGDAITGDMYFTMTEGESDAALMNTVCFDTFTVGNHEFDNTDNGLKKFIGFLNNSDCKTKTVTLSANIKFGATSPLKDSDLVKPSTIIEREGQKIGLIGLTIAGKTKNSSRPNTDTTFEDEAIAAQREIDRLKAQGINKIIIQSHYGYEQDQALAKKLKGVDVIIGGDSHTLLGPQSMTTYGISPAGDYPTKTTDQDGNPVCIAQAWQYSYVVGELNVKFDKDGKVTSCGGTPWMLLGDSFKKGNNALTATELASVRADIEKSKVLTIVQPDAKAQSILAPFQAAKKLFGEKQVAVASTDLCLRRVPGTFRDSSRSTLGDTCNKADHVNQHGGDTQQLVAEAFLDQGKKFFNADLSIQNGGGVRIDLPKGMITVGTIYTLLPFKNETVQLKATGAEIKATLEDAMDSVVNGNSGSYPYSGGLRWSVDLNKAKGQRISNLELRNASGAYQPFDLSKTYNVVTINFLADGQDGYTTLGTITGDRRIEVGLDYADAFLKYIEESIAGEAGKKPLSRLPTAVYSTQHFIDTPPPAK